MKKMIFILCVAIFLTACSIVQKSPSFIEIDKMAQKRPSLTEINKAARDMSAELFEKEKQNTLTEEEKEILSAWRSSIEKEEMKRLLEYSVRNIDLADVLTLVWGGELGYTEQELDEFLKLGLYVKNPYCENEFDSYEVFQVFPDFVLADGCEITSYDKCSTSHGRIFMFPKQEGELYFDKKILTPPSDFCSVYVGVYSYETRVGVGKTVPILYFLPKEIDKVMLNNIKKMREETQRIKE